MNAIEFHKSRKFIFTSFGRIAYVERGSGPVALFIHGLPLNGYHWRHAVESLSDIRRCIALDLMGLGHTEISPDQDLTFTNQARMVEAFLNALQIEEVDLVGSDSGGAVSQIFAARAPGRVRTLTLTNCDVHDNWPPAAFAMTQQSAKAGRLKLAMKEMLNNLALARSDFGLGVCFEFPERLTEETVQTYLQPLAATEENGKNLERYVTSYSDCSETVKIEEQLKKFTAPTLVLWGTKDVFFPVKWAYWLKNTIPGVREVVELPGAKLFFAEEYPELVSEKLRGHWTAGAGSASRDSASVEMQHG